MSYYHNIYQISQGAWLIMLPLETERESNILTDDFIHWKAEKNIMGLHDKPLIYTC